MFCVFSFFFEHTQNHSSTLSAASNLAFSLTQALLLNFEFSDEIAVEGRNQTRRATLASKIAICLNFEGRLRKVEWEKAAFRDHSENFNFTFQSKS